jgi:diguanylate cyclase (GGDEF)-like protein
MRAAFESWSTQQLAEFVALISGAGDEQQACQLAVERAAEALEVEVCALVQDGQVRASIGFGWREVPVRELVAVAERGMDRLELGLLGPTRATSAALEGEPASALVVARVGEEGFTQEELDLLRGIARVLALTLRMVRTLDQERELRRRSQHEVRQRKKVERELAHQALHDGLTGLANRTLLRDRTANALGPTAGVPALVAALSIDLDHFKQINESLGHRRGDRLLQALAERLERALAPHTLARVGSDEFVILCEGLREEREAIVVAEQVQQAVREPLVLEGSEVALTASVGVAVRAGGGASRAEAWAAADDLLRDADVAMSRAKEGGRDRYEVFDEQMRLRLLERLALEADLRTALERRELRLVYQPVVAVADAETVALEALVRWEHPVHGALSPAKFIPIAEESDLIVELGEWVITEVCEQLASWRRAGAARETLRVSVNVSARQLTPRLARFLSDTLARTGVTPEQIALEITESLLIEHADSSHGALATLKALGVAIVLDDFGTGYSSLSYLKSFPLDQIKLDRSFIFGLVDDPRSAKIVSATIDMARALGMTVVAEGLETAEQLNVLQRLGCDYAQGYHFARPQPAEAVAVWLARSGGGAVARSSQAVVESASAAVSGRPGAPFAAADDVRRRVFIGRVASLFFCAGGLLIVPANSMLGGAARPQVALALALLGLVSGAACLALPWRRLSLRSVHLTGLLATAEVALTVWATHRPSVFSWFYVLIAVAAAYAFSDRRTVVAYAVLLAGTMALPLAGGGDPTGELVARTLVGIAVLTLTMAVTAALRERLEARQDELRLLAVRDPLTGVGNYRLLHDRLEYELRRHQRARRRFALLLVDLDRFKEVNERLGHAAGDEALRRVARALQAAVRQQDTVVRQGGDEFAVLAPETDRAAAGALARRIEAEIGRITFAGLQLGATVGAAVFPDDGGSEQVLLARADGRLLTGKADGRSAATSGGAGDPEETDHATAAGRLLVGS